MNDQMLDLNDKLVDGEGIDVNDQGLHLNDKLVDDKGIDVNDQGLNENDKAVNDEGVDGNDQGLNGNDKAMNDEGAGVNDQGLNRNDIAVDNEGVDVNDQGLNENDMAVNIDQVTFYAPFVQEDEAMDHVLFHNEDFEYDFDATNFEKEFPWTKSDCETIEDADTSALSDDTLESGTDESSATWRGKGFKDMLWKCATTTTVREFQSQMEELKKYNVECYKWLIQIPPQHWARSHFSDRSKSDVLLNNMCEVFNAKLVEGRDKPIISALEYVREHMMKRIANVSMVIDKCKGPLTPTATKMLEAIKKDAEDYTVMWNGEVYQGGETSGKGKGAKESGKSKGGAEAGGKARGKLRRLKQVGKVAGFEDLCYRIVYAEAGGENALLMVFFK
ncbi:hypothetical protein L1987_57983 [Smallanthus sonchifolius]|uniref:Uncharacterized protein n=1 Tax=Smallanthus sonchifolius TaxID=185202 RepID=A0ACB9DEB2_9ASTR|nr:hypothetical protein L1987_57983 [Smallanthus sonchifolius]